MTNTTFEGVCGIEGIQNHILSYANFRSLHLLRFNMNLARYANKEMERRALHVTDEDVAAGKHVKRLRRFFQKAKRGQTIYLASGVYMLGDESVRGHANETIFYDTNGKEN